MEEKQINHWALFGIIILLFLFSFIQADIKSSQTIESKDTLARLKTEVLPAEGVELPVRWGDLGKQMAEAGVVDKEKFLEIYKARENEDEARRFLEKNITGNLRMTAQNSGLILNLLWALGVGNKNPILEKGPMANFDGKTPKNPAELREKAGYFASTGGWGLAKGSAMDYYSRYKFIELTTDEQALVERVSKNIYRPCCDNPTYFPDCNHGMGMLALLELMASQGVSESEMYRTALQVNSYWFPDTYVTLAQYLESKGSSWAKSDPKELLGKKYSSASGYQAILKKVTPLINQGGGSCGA